jgi:hypothetical protein
MRATLLYDDQLNVMHIGCPIVNGLFCGHEPHPLDIGPLGFLDVDDVSGYQDYPKCNTCFAIATDPEKLAARVLESRLDEAT